MLQQKEFLKLLPVAMTMQNDLDKLNEANMKNILSAKFNVGVPNDQNIALAKEQIIKALLCMNLLNYLREQFDLFYTLLDKFVQMNFDWCQDNLSHEQQEFLEML